VGDLQKQNGNLRDSVTKLEQQLVARENLIRRIALVLADPPSAYKDSTVEDVCHRVIAFEGNTATEADIAEALAWMLDAGAIYRSGRGLELSNNWRDRLQVIG
jgi:hypothetical protein